MQPAGESQTFPPRPAVQFRQVICLEHVHQNISQYPSLTVKIDRVW